MLHLLNLAQLSSLAHEHSPLSVSYHIVLSYSSTTLFSGVLLA